MQQHPRLLAALTQLLPDEGERTAAISAFRNLNELAVATAICQQQKVSLERLSKIVAGPPRRSLRRAVRELKPSEAPRSVVQAAQTEAKKLLAEKSP